MFHQLAKVLVLLENLFHEVCVNILYKNQKFTDFHSPVLLPRVAPGLKITKRFYLRINIYSPILLIRYLLLKQPQTSHKQILSNFLPKFLSSQIKTKIKLTDFLRSVRFVVVITPTNFNFD